MAQILTTDMEFGVYMASFERRVVMEGAKKGYWGRERDFDIRGGFGQTAIGKLVGTVFHYEEPAVIVYIWHPKKSTGFLALAARMWPAGLRRLRTAVVNFTDISLDDVAILAPDLLPGYEEFRKRVFRAVKESSK